MSDEPIEEPHVGELDAKALSTAMSETIPDAILAEARAAFGTPWGEEPEDTAAVHRIAQALLAAEKRGAERAAEIAERFDGDGVKTNYGCCIASAIRKGAS